MVGTVHGQDRGVDQVVQRSLGDALHHHELAQRALQPRIREEVVYLVPPDDHAADRRAHEGGLIAHRVDRSGRIGPEPLIEHVDERRLGQLAHRPIIVDGSRA